MMESFAYLRLSVEDRDKEEKSLSPENQLGIIKCKIEENGDVLVSVFEDINKSGKEDSIIFRNGFKELMLRISENSSPKRVYVKDLSRFSRSLLDQEISIKKLKEYNAELVSCDGITDKITRRIQAIVNEQYIDDLRKKCEQLHSLKMSQNKVVVRLPFGYGYNKKAKEAFVSERKAVRVREIFSLFISGKPIGEISSFLRMSFGRVYSILHNKVYTGKLCYNGREYGTIPFIISGEVFNQAQALIEERKVLAKAKRLKKWKKYFKENVTLPSGGVC